jgi:hypothetical protein
VQRYEGINDLISIQIEFLKSSDISLIKSYKEDAQEFQIHKRQRFLSEDNSHPSYQVLNFQNLILQDEYLSNDCSNKNMHRTTKASYYNMAQRNSMISEEPSEYFNLRMKKLSTYKITNLNQDSKQMKIEGIGEKEEKECNSRKSTEMKSHLKSKRKDSISMDELEQSFEITIDEDNHIVKGMLLQGIDEVHDIHEIREDEMIGSDEKNKPSFNISDIVDKAEKLKNVFNS